MVFQSSPRVRFGRVRARALVATGIFGQFAAFAAAALIGACGDDSPDGTAGKRVVLHTRVELVEGGEAFTTGVGWQVALSRAVVSVEALRYYDGVPPLAALPRNPELGELAARFLGVSVAHAHPGHYQAGNVLGEMLEPASLDLLAGPSVLADADGVSGTYRSAQWAFAATPAGAFSGELDGHVVVLEGTATKDGEQTRSFRAAVDFGELAASSNDGQVVGCVFEQVRVESDGEVTVKVRPAPWFNLVDFSQIEPGTTEEPAEFPIDSQPRIALAQGLAQHSAYLFSYQPE